MAKPVLDTCHVKAALPGARRKYETRITGARGSEIHNAINLWLRGIAQKLGVSLLALDVEEHFIQTR